MVQSTPSLDQLMHYVGVWQVQMLAAGSGEYKYLAVTWLATNEREGSRRCVVAGTLLVASYRKVLKKVWEAFWSLFQ